jgi:hypothetical protein
VSERLSDIVWLSDNDDDRVTDSVADFVAVGGGVIVAVSVAVGVGGGVMVAVVDADVE